MQKVEPFCSRMRCENLYIEEEGLQSLACRSKGQLHGYVDGCQTLPMFCPKMNRQEEKKHE
jgi:hypothetical protein